MGRLFIASLLFALAVLRPALADQNDPRLDALFEILRTGPSYEHVVRAEAQIWIIWTQHDDESAQLLMNDGVRAMNLGDMTRARGLFDVLIAEQPKFAEAWNKRATVNYLLADYEASLKDIEATLALEPRHFGALAGRGLVQSALGNVPEAIASFEQTLVVHPWAPGAHMNLESLRRANPPI